jgi:nucleoside 2-deoxyribosyltransferase
MNARLVYLAGPIYDCDDTCVEWRRDAAIQLRRNKIMTLSPMNRDYRGREGNPIVRKLIVEKDKRDILMCDTIIAVCDQPSFGTAMEILFAWSLQKQILVVTRHGSPWIHYHATKVFETLDDAIASLAFTE